MLKKYCIFEQFSGAQLLEDVADSSHAALDLASRHHHGGSQLLENFINGCLRSISITFS
jgi:hypothetical protein